MVGLLGICGGEGRPPYNSYTRYSGSSFKVLSRGLRQTALVTYRADAQTEIGVVEMNGTMKVLVSAMAVVVCSLVGATAYAEENPNLFRSETARIELVKPQGWHFMDLESVAKHRAAAKLKDEDMQQAIFELATAPLFAATKYPEPYEALNPSLQVLVRPLGNMKGASGAEILALVLQSLESAFVDFKLLEPVSEFELDGLVAAALKASYTVENQAGDGFPTETVMMVIPRDSFMYQFSFSAPPEGEDALSNDTLVDVLESIRFLE